MDLESLAARIERECRPYLCLVETNRGYLCRGAGLDAPEVFEGSVLRDRKPKNMPPHLHEAADRWFSRIFGVRYRGAGLFCTGDNQQAQSHGRVYRIYPIGAFQFCWSPHVVDLHEWCKARGFLHKAGTELTHALSELDYRDEGLKDAIESCNEVMVACSRYLAVSEEIAAQFHIKN